MYPFEFKGKEDNSSGIAAFMVEGKRFVVALDSFEDCKIISRMLALAHDQGKSFAARSMRDCIFDRARTRCIELEVNGEF